MRSRFLRLTVTILILPLVVCPFLLVLPSGQAYAAPVLDLELDDPGVIRWNIGNIMPGDSGMKSINLHNTGDITGYLYIWIADLVDDEGVNPEPETGDTGNPGELSHYISLDIINAGMTFRKLSGTGLLVNVVRPIMLDAFPANSNTSLYIVNPPIGAGQTLELQWQWQFLPAAGNEVQGDTVSFSVYYMLGPQQSSGYGGGSLPKEEPDLPPPEVTPVDTTDNTNPEPAPPPARGCASDDGRCLITIPEGLRVITESGQELEYVVIDIPDEVPPLPEPFIFIAPVYRIIVHTEDGISEGTRLRQPVRLTIYFDTDKIPENAEVYIVSYHPDSGWVRLDYSGDPSRGQLSAWMDYLNMVAIVVGGEVAEIVEIPVEPDTPEQVPPAPEVAPPDVTVLDSDTEALSGGMMLLKHASLGVAVSGSVAMAVLAFIQRRRRRGWG
jgi:hypothetical protein